MGQLFFFLSFKFFLRFFLVWCWRNWARSCSLGKGRVSWLCCISNLGVSEESGTNRQDFCLRPKTHFFKNGFKQSVLVQRVFLFCTSKRRNKTRYHHWVPSARPTFHISLPKTQSCGICELFWHVPRFQRLVPFLSRTRVYLNSSSMGKSLSYAQNQRWVLFDLFFVLKRYP